MRSDAAGATNLDGVVAFSRFSHHFGSQWMKLRLMGSGNNDGWLATK
jgi:hypothetical protein